jgi:hypothetical protein
LITAGSVALATEAPARADNSAGQGSSYAQSFQVTPHDGSLAVGLVLGESLAGHTGTAARAQSQGVDLGAIGTALTTENCGTTTFKPSQIPQPFETETGASGSSAGQTQGPTSGGFGSTEHILANSVPYGEADTSFASVGTSLMSVSGLASKAWSGLVNGQREAGSTSDVASISLLSGMVKLGGMHWEATYPSGGAAKPSGLFTLNSLSIANTPVPLNNLDESAIAATINKVLNSLGMELKLPVVTTGKIESVTPLELDVIPNTTRDNLLDSLLGKVSPILNPVKTGLETGFGPWEPAPLVTQLCQTDTPFTVADISIASMTGAGFFSTTFGGVDASSSALPANAFNLNINLGSVTLGGNSQFIPGTPGSSGLGATGGTPASPAIAGTPGTPGTTGTLTTPTSNGSSTTSAPQQQAQAVQPASAGFKAGGPLLAVGLGGLGLLALLIEGDRRMMRRAQHTVNFEE